MNKGESKKICSILIAAYPVTYSKITQTQAETMIELWRSCFPDASYRVVSEALRRFIVGNASEFPPTIGQIADMIDSMDAPEDETMTGAQAWAIVAEAIRDSTYHSEERFTEFPEVIRIAVGSPANLRALGLSDSQTVHSVEKSNFLRQFEAAKERIKRQRKEVNLLRIAQVKRDEKKKLQAVGD